MLGDDNEENLEKFIPIVDILDENFDQTFFMSRKNKTRQAIKSRDLSTWNNTKHFFIVIIV